MEEQEYGGKIGVVLEFEDYNELDESSNPPRPIKTVLHSGGIAAVIAILPEFPYSIMGTDWVREHEELVPRLIPKVQFEVPDARVTVNQKVEVPFPFPVSLRLFDFYASECLNGTEIDGIMGEDIYNSLNGIVTQVTRLNGSDGPATVHTQFECDGESLVLCADQYTTVLLFPSPENINYT